MPRTRSKARDDEDDFDIDFDHDVESETADEKPAKRSRRGGRRAARANEVDAEEVDDDGGEEAEERPARRRRSRSADEREKAESGDERPRRRRSRSDSGQNEESEERPSRRRSRKEPAAEEEDAGDERPSRRSRGRAEADGESESESEGSGRRRRRGRGRRRRGGSGEGGRGGSSDREPATDEKVLLINALQPEESRIAITENGRLEELYVERDSQENIVGNIYKGKVVNVEPTIQAAFVDFGEGKNGFLHISDVEASYFPDFKPPRTTREDADGRKRRINERSVSMKPPIQDVLSRGSEVLVQVIKEAIGTKGPTLSTYVSIPGRYLVLMPAMQRVGVSRKIEDEKERKQLKRILRDIDPPEGLGFIIRTAGVGRSADDLQRDLDYLIRLWKRIVTKLEGTSGVGEVYAETDVILRTVRDTFSDEIDRVWVDDPDAYQRLLDFMKSTMPKAAGRVTLYDKQAPLFHHFKIEKGIEEAQERYVKLPGGGSIVIDQTEALVAIDVNSGKYRSPDGDPEMTAFNVNLEAADEISRQLRLRDIGGVVVCDFIDMRADRHRRKVEKRLIENMERDKARTKVLRISPFGLIEMTRQRIRPSLRKSVYQDCPCCGGLGYVKTEESVAIDVMRALMTVGDHDDVESLEVEVHAETAHHLTNAKRRALTEFEEDYEVEVRIAGRSDVFPEHMVVRGLNANGRKIDKLTVEDAHVF